MGPEGLKLDMRGWGDPSHLANLIDPRTLVTDAAPLQQVRTKPNARGPHSQSPLCLPDPHSPTPWSDSDLVTGVLSLFKVTPVVRRCQST